MAKKGSSRIQPRAQTRSSTDWASGIPPGMTIPTQSNSRPASSTYLPDLNSGAGSTDPNIVGTTPSGNIPPPGPQAFIGDPGNLPGIAGGPPKLGTPLPTTPPPITMPPAQGQGQGQQTGQSAQWQPPSNLPANGNLVGWTPPPPSGGPNPMSFQGDPGNLPGISGGPPPLGSPLPTPPKITPPAP